MIRFTLTCDTHHSFESWFRDNAAFDEQAVGGFISCPFCGSAKVEKAIMAPQVARKDREPPPQATGREVALVSPEEAQIRAKLKELHEAIASNSHYVGDKFADEARKIHLGETETRSIHGEANQEEVRSLLEDGIDIMPIPRLPDDRN